MLPVSFLFCTEKSALPVDKSTEMMYNVFVSDFRSGRKIPVRGKAALTGEIAVPCTCNPLKQG